MAEPQVSSSDCRGLFPVLAWAAFARFGKRPLSGRTPAPAAGGEGLPSKIPAALQEKSCTHISASRLITSNLSWEDMFFWHQLSARFFWALILHVFGRVLSWNRAPPRRAVKVPRSAIKPRGIYSQRICTCEYLSAASSQPPSKADGTAHSSHMSEKQGAESLWRTTALSWKCPKLFPNCSVTRL